MLGLEPLDSLALSLHHAPGACAVLVGSGLSRAAGIPTGWEITLDLIRRLAAMKGVTEAPDWAGWYRTEMGAEPNYSAIIDALATTPTERRALLHRYIEPQGDEDVRKPTKAHAAIAQLVVDGAIKVILTTNFDRLLENALRDRGIEPTVITDEHSLAGATPLAHARCTVIKLHGDYLDTRIKNTDAELAAYHADMDGLLDRVFDEYGLIVVGWSGEWDIALRRGLLRASTRRYPLFWAARGTVAPLAQDIIDHRKGQSFAIVDADAFLGGLTDKLGAIRAADRPHPVTVAAALAQAKRYCRADEFDAEWAEFIEAEASKIRAHVGGPDWPTEQPSNENVQALVAAVMARTEVLRRAFMVAARWGTPRAQSQLVRSLAGLSMTASSVGGYDTWSNLRDLPAAVCFYWAIAGAVHAGNHRLAAQLMNRQLPIRNRTTLPAVFMLPLLTLDDRGTVWPAVISGEYRGAPVASMWLEKNLPPELADIAASPEEAQSSIDEVEFLIGLEFSFHRASDPNSAWPWFPTGHYVYRNSGQEFERRLSLADALPTDHAWLKAGFLGGKPEGGKLATANMRDTLKRR